MRILDLNEYINEKLNIKPVSKDRLDSFKEPEVDDETRQYIEDYNFVWNPSTRCYDCDEDIRVLEDIVSDGKLKIRFGKVNGDFYCYNNELTTLEGTPRKVGGDFQCMNNKLTTLESAPQEVGGDFSCSGNHLTTLEGAPQKVGGDFYCSKNNLTTLEGAPQEVGGDFYCSNNPNLVLPKEKPSWIKGNIIQ